MKKKLEEQKLPVWRYAAAILLTIAAALFLVYGSIMITAKDAISGGMIRKVVNQVDLNDEYGEDATKAINIGIVHLTGSQEAHLSREELLRYLDIPSIKLFLIDKLTEMSKALTSDYCASIEVSEIAPYFDRIKEYAEQKTGTVVSSAQVELELAKAFGAERYETIEEAHILYPGRAVACIIVGVILLVLVYALAWPKIPFGSAMCVIGCILICTALIVSGLLVQKVAGIDEIALVLGSGFFRVWLKKVSGLFIRRAFLSLLGCVIPVGLSIFYIHDRRHVKKIWKSNRE